MKTKKNKFEVGLEEVKSRKEMGGEGSVGKNGVKVSWRFSLHAGDDRWILFFLICLFYFV